MPSNFDQIPCPVLVTDRNGLVESLNQNLLKLLGGVKENWLKKPMENMFTMASRVFLQTHVWPLVLHEGQVCEIRLQIMDQAKKQVPVYVNCQKTAWDSGEICTWVFFVTFERSRYEQQLVQARQRADETAAELTKSERFIRSVADAMPGAIAYWNTELRCQFVNKTYQTWFGKNNQDMQGVAIQTVLGSSLFEQNYPLMKKVLNGENQQFERPMKKQDGSIVDSLISYITDRDVKGNINGFFAVVRDISGLREADAAIKLSASVFEATTESIAVMDEAWNIVSTNKAFSNLTGYSPEEIKGQSVNILKSTGNDKDFFRSVNRQIEARKVWKGEVWCKRKDGSILLTRLSITAILTKDNVVSSYVAMSADITKQRKAERRMQFMSLHDGLTGLPNRSLLMERIAQLIAISARESRHIALLFLDLDGFKQVNDTWGHATGDRVLKAVATRLLSLVRPSDTIARIGGDEFVILLDNPESIDNVKMIAARVIDSVNMPIMVDEQISHIGTSIGISFFRQDNATPEDLLKRADAAMYKAKAAGKNTYQFSD